MQICVKDKVNGNEYWDNNNRWNYEVKFKTQDIALYKVLNELVAGLEELKVYGNVMHGQSVIEDRDDY